MKIIKKTSQGIDYLSIRLKSKQKVNTNAVLWRIPRTNDDDDIHLKIGRYNYEQNEALFDDYKDNPTPKSELTLDREEFLNLITFLKDCYEPFSKGIQKFIPIETNIEEDKILAIKKIFSNSKQTEIVNFLISNDIISNDIFSNLEFINKKNAIIEFEKLLEDESYFESYKKEKNIKQDEAVWQKWFENNSWVLGAEFVKVFDERRIDAQNIADFFVKAYDGFVDIIEIKKSKKIDFWQKDTSHNNLYPSSELIKSITQCLNYIYEIERESNSNKFIEKLEYSKVIKPRIILIIGRSKNWHNQENEAYRLLNSAYHNLTIMTYDHVLQRAKRILKV
jgi:hypothetical protein